jgi:uncharacterized protein (DUF342 family)
LLADKEGQSLRAVIRRAGEVQIAVSEDGMAVTLSVTAAEGGGKFVTAGDVIAQLKALGVIQGVDLEAISCLVGEVLKTGKSVGPRQIAAGRAPTPGKHGTVIPLPGEMLPGNSGRRKQEWMARQGAVLVKLVPPIAGVPGVNVFGQEIPAATGRPASLTIQPGVVFNAHDGTYLAAFDGLAVFDGQTLEVRRQLVWMGDLTLNDKAIEFDGTVIIRGTVRDGAKVVATEDIDVQAGIEAATVISTGGAVRVKQGVAGRGCGFVSAKTIVDVRYLENAIVYCEGDILVRHAVIHSRLTAGKKVNVDSGKGVVFGGDVRAGTAVMVKCLGNAAGIATRVSVGHNWDILQQLREQEQIMAGLRQQVLALEKVIEQFKHARPDLSRLSDTERGALCAVVRRHIVLKSQSKEEERKYQEIDASWTLAGEGEIHCAETLFSGTCIKMGSATTLVSVSQPTCTVRFSSEQKRIAAVAPSGRRLELI